MMFKIRIISKLRIYFQREEISKDLINEKEREVNGTGSESLLDMFRTPNLRVNAVLVNIIW